MIAAYPLVVAIAVAIVMTRDRPTGRGWRWFGAWSLGGASLTLSFLTGFSIGLLLLPAAAAAVLVVAWAAPHVAESTGFVTGLGATLLVVAAVSGDDRDDPRRWLVGGALATAASLAGYTLARRGRD